MRKFKVGDKVKCINPGDNPLTIGNIYEVIILDYAGDPKYRDDKGNISFYASSRFELVESNEFNVGDKVRAKDDCTNDFRDGEGIIEIIDHYGLTDEIRLRIRVTKESKCYKAGALTNEYDWRDYIELIPCEELIKENMEEITFDEVKKMPKDVIGAANLEVLAEIADEQKAKAKVVLRKMYNEKNALEEQTKESNAKMKELTEDLKQVNA
jgi:hypothetical protein